MDYNISLSALFWLCGGIGALIGIIAVAKKPFDQLSDHERRIGKLEDDKTERRETDKAILSALSAIVDHMIAGNNVDEMKKVRDELRKNIIDGHK